MAESKYVPTAYCAWLPAEALWHSEELTLWAFCKMTHIGLTTTSFVNVRHGADEPFIKFPDKLKAALHKQIDNITARPILLKQCHRETLRSLAACYFVGTRLL